MRLIAIGRLRGGPEVELFARYATRLRPALELTELPEAQGGSATEIKRREAASLLGALPAQARAIALDLGGQAPDSATLARLLDGWLAQPQPLCFLVGGAEGLDASVLARANHALSLGPLTWPHFLVRPMLAEQLYRARCISTGHPYHRAGRP